MKFFSPKKSDVFCRVRPRDFSYQRVVYGMCHEGRQKRSIEGFGGKPGVNSPFRKPRSWWECSMKIGHQDVGWGLDWIDPAQERKK
jgi:hypothetical protein